ncbi:MAG: Rpn family recombination-promoting nuclease/putative transposase, partial [Spirochaetota bacterium]
MQASGVNPLVDCVFKKLLGSDEHKTLLIHFLNAVLASFLGQSVNDVEILNPYTLQDTFTDKLTIVDVKAKDSNGLIFQIEVQLSVYKSLRERMLYTWAGLYAKQLKQGEPFRQIPPVISIWLLGENLFKNCSMRHIFQLRDGENKITLTDTGTI